MESAGSPATDHGQDNVWSRCYALALPDSIHLRIKAGALRMSHKTEHDHRHHQSEHRPRKGIHHSPWFWVAVILMLIAMVYYVFSDDLALAPGPQQGQGEPAAGP
jgi:hypothetical protein